MALNTQGGTITAEQYADLKRLIINQDRVGFYVALHLMTGSQAALDMAEISSSSDIRGGVAWAVNEAYEGIWDEYPDVGVEGFSIQIALGDFEDIQLIAGTNAISDVLTDAQMFLQGVNQQKSHVILLVQWAKEFAVGARARVSVTGHSLGGGLAQFTAVEFGLSGETFNAFGVAEMVGGARADRRKAVQAGTRTSVSTMTHESDLA